MANDGHNQQQPAQEQRRPLTAMELFTHQLTGENMKAQIAAQLPAGIDAERFIRTVLTVVRMQPDLLECDRTSLLGACMLAAKDGLNPDGKEATIQPYNCKVKDGNVERWVKMAQYMPMVRGLLKQLYNTGDIAMIDAAAVYEKDKFTFARGDNPRLEHEPYLGADDPGKVIAAYAVVKMKDGEIKREVMARRDIEKVREASKSKDGPGWKNWYDQFAIKAVLKRVYKQLPSSSEAIERLIKNDNDALGIEFDQRGGGKNLLAITAEQKVAVPQGTQARGSRMADKLRGEGVDDAVIIKSSDNKQETSDGAQSQQ